MCCKTALSGSGSPPNQEFRSLPVVSHEKRSPLLEVPLKGKWRGCPDSSVAKQWAQGGKRESGASTISWVIFWIHSRAIVSESLSGDDSA